MKEYSLNEFRELALSELEKAIKENPNRVKIYSRTILTAQPYHIVDAVHIFEREPPPYEQERIYIAPSWDVRIIYRDQAGVTASLDDILATLGTYSSKLLVRVQLKILKKPDRKKVLAKLFDKFFVIESDHPIYLEEDSHGWFSMPEYYLFEVDRKEALLMLA